MLQIQNRATNRTTQRRKKALEIGRDFRLTLVTMLRASIAVLHSLVKWHHAQSVKRSREI